MKSSISFRLRPLDILALAAAIALFAASLAPAAGRRSETQLARITGDGGEWVYPLSANAELEIPGPLGITYVHIEDGAVAVTDSPCREKICVATGQVSRPGGWIACLPNRVFVRVAGGEAEVDQVVY